MVCRHLIAGGLRRILLCVSLLAGASSSAIAEKIDAHILLQDSPLAGFQFHAGKKLWPEMRVGDALSLVREPDNAHDARAVRVEWRGQHIGYVPRRENTDVARFLDHGKRLSARITRLKASSDPWARVRFEILLPLESGVQ